MAYNLQICARCEWLKVKSKGFGSGKEWFCGKESFDWRCIGFQDWDNNFHRAAEFFNNQKNEPPESCPYLLEQTI